MASDQETGKAQDVESGIGVTHVAKDQDSDSINKTAKAASLSSFEQLTEILNPINNSHTNQLSLSEVEPVDIQIRNLAVEVDISPSKLSVATILPNKRKQDAEAVPKTKSILRNVSADMPSGTLTAIIGGSGSGKSSLLNSIAERMSSGKLTLSGKTTFNGKECIGSIRSAYVLQQDILQSSLTVRETLQYSADLRLPPPTTEAERRRIVEEVILELGLKDCANTRIGDHAHKGCSGGEKRRTSIGVQLLSNPSVLFLDEPTTGLDSGSSFSLIRTLKGLAKKGRTVVTTIHQPRSEIWGLFDRLVIFSRGSLVYSGTIEACLPYFERQGFRLPEFVNPAEFLIDIAAIDNRSPELEAVSLERVEKLKLAWKTEAETAFDDQQEMAPLKNENEEPTQTSHTSAKQQSAFWRQFCVLTSRTIKVTYRDPMGMAGSLVEAIFMGIMTGWVFYGLKEDQSGIRSREGALYTAAALQGYLILIFETYRLTLDIQLFDRERGEGVVGVLPWILSRRAARFFVEDIPVPLLYSAIFYWMAGFRADAGQFFTFFAVILLSNYIAVTFAMTCVAVSRNFAGASLVANMGYTIQSMACGFFIQSNSIPVYVRWLKWTAYVYYSFGALCANEFIGRSGSATGYFYACPYAGEESNPACAQYTGVYIMSSLGLPHNWIVRPIIILLAFSVMFYTVAGFTLQYKRVRMSIAQARNSDTDLSAGKEKMMARSFDEVRTIDIGLDGYALDLEKRSAYGTKLPTKTILQPVNASFQAGVLNIIMGPSGSGKTSLLNAMALRLHGNATTSYRPYGKMTFNGAIPSDSVIRSVCSYVCQDDDALLPSLTVRETLRFSAGLRLPSYMSKDEKDKKADDVLMKMGLKDCAHNLIGNDLIKGISGGEKRRVSIAIQILTAPQVLLLDEPTSGLDSYTSTSIFDVLNGLAMEGRTLILTIHQSRSDLFKHFGNILLLARGGAPVYSGPGDKMLTHFSSLGFICPRTTNPADFALDLVTVDLRHSEKEAASQFKIESLIKSWNKTPKPLTDKLSSIATPAELGSYKRNMARFHTSYPLLVRRALINFRRQPPLIIARIMQVLGLGIILALFFAPLHHDYYSVQTRLGFIQEICAFYFVGMLQNIAIYPDEKAVFYREYDDGAYSIEAFFMQYLTNEIPFEVVTSLLFACLADLGVGLPRTAQMFFVTFFNCFCIVSCGESLGIMFNTLFDHTGFAVNITSIFLSVAQFMSGIMSIDMPGFLSGVNYLSPIRYAIRNLAPYSLRSIHFHCKNSQLVNGACPITSGQEVLELYNLDTNPWVNIIALGVTTIIYRILAYLLLKIKKSHWRSFLRKERSVKEKPVA